MKLRLSVFLSFSLAIHSLSAFSQSFVDNSYGYLDPNEIYDQSKYFDAKRIEYLESSLGLPTNKEIANVGQKIAQLKNAARSQFFAKRVFPMTLAAFAYHALSGAVYVTSFAVTAALSLCTGVQPGAVNLFSAFGASLLLNGAVNMIMSDSGLVDTYQHLYGGAPPRDALMNLEAHYVAHKHLIPEHLQQKAEEMLFSTRLGATAATTTKSYVSTLIALQKAQTRKCAITKTWPEIEAEISRALSRNSEDTREEILNLAYTYYRNANSENTSLARLVAYIHGLPGIGKSRAASLVAKAFGVPVVVLKLPGVSPAKLWGTDGTEPGLIVTKIAELGCSSGFFILEDVDHAIAAESSADLSATLLDLFDTTQLSFMNAFLEAEVDTSKIFMIATGNLKLAKEALEDRANLVHLDDLPVESKEGIALEEYLPKRLAEWSIKPEDFAAVEPKLKLAIANSKSAGMRSVQRLVEKELAIYGRAQEKQAAQKPAQQPAQLVE